MFDSGTVLIALIAVVITLVVVRYIKARRPVPNYPPGPMGLPIVGSLPQFLGREDYHRYFMELGEKYGSVCSYMFGKLRIAKVFS
ncbi:Cytochrome P450 81E8 [Holothuria leucospilota]|uniref:Cytochrome P450 81E8 n=1 Tax=Holothuria leucospilota TaxID=206669 RepID=A0A9Q1BDN0_HOLLE|nr:Cytochrome P450 81E8 [Holothuria leucospilota]